MQKTKSKLWVRFIPLLMVLSLVIAACGGSGLTATLSADSTSVDVGETVTLTASATDATGALQYAYDIESPSGSTVTTLPGTGSTTSFVPDVAGEYTATVTITDADGNTDEDSAEVTANAVDSDAFAVSITPATFSEALPTGGSDTGGVTGGSEAGTLTEEFTATATNADGDVSYSWSVTPSEGAAFTPETGETTTVTFSEAGTYTIEVEAEDDSNTVSATVTATIAAPGDEPEEPVTGGPGGDTDPTLTSFGVSDSDSGPFLNDGADDTNSNGISSEDDDRVLDINPGETFYIQVGVSDPEGVDTITVQLRNVDTDGDGSNNVTPLVEGADVQGFTLGAPDCTLPTTDDSVTCVYPVVTSADADESNLTSGEFAYVFRVEVNDVELSGFGNRGYVNTAVTN